MKRCTLLVFLLFTLVGGFSRGDVKDIDRQLDKGGYHYVTNDFGDNWFISGGAGAQLFIGKWRGAGALGDRITPALSLSVGKWITPRVGLRATMDGFQLKSYTRAKTGLEERQPLYKQRWNYFNLHGDILYNLTAAIGGYNPKRLYECIPYAGFGWGHTRNINNNVFSFNAGIINRFRINDYLDINLELKGVILDHSFDDELVPIRVEGIISVVAGVTYRFNARPFERCGATAYNPGY